MILAKTIKGYGLGEAGEGRNIAHNKKKQNEQELLEFRTRFGIPISDDEVLKVPFYRPRTAARKMKYITERRAELGGSIPSTTDEAPATMEVPRYRRLSQDHRTRQRQRNFDDDGFRSTAGRLV